MSVSWEAAQRIRSGHGLGEPGFTVTNEICAAMTAETRAWQKVNDPDRREKRLQRMWRSAQLVDGRIVGSWAETLLEAQIELEVWWGAAVAWIVEDPDVLVYRRYLGEASTAETRSREAITFPVTSGPVDHPSRDGTPVFVQGEFDFGDLT